VFHLSGWARCSPATHAGMINAGKNREPVTTFEIKRVDTDYFTEE
jgi:hypothetical protein